MSSGAPEPPSIQSEIYEAAATAPPPAMFSRASPAERGMVVWQKRNEGRDFGRAMRPSN
jgi:hypothetical protein